MTSVKCPHCNEWIGGMEVHEDCARKMDEAKRDIAERWLAETNPSPEIAKILKKISKEGAN